MRWKSSGDEQGGIPIQYFKPVHPVTHERGLAMSGVFLGKVVSVDFYDATEKEMLCRVADRPGQELYQEDQLVKVSV